MYDVVNTLTIEDGKEAAKADGQSGRGYRQKEGGAIGVLSLAIQKHESDTADASSEEQQT